MSELKQLVLKKDIKSLEENKTVLKSLENIKEENITESIVLILFQNSIPLSKDELRKQVDISQFLICDGLTLFEMKKLQDNWINAIVEKDIASIIAQCKALNFGLKEKWSIPIQILFNSFK